MSAPGTPGRVEQNRFQSMATKDLAAQCRMQARENLDPEYSQFMEAVADRLADAASPALYEALEAMVELGDMDVSGTALIYRNLREVLAAARAALALANPTGNASKGEA